MSRARQEPISTAEKGLLQETSTGGKRRRSEITTTEELQREDHGTAEETQYKYTSRIETVKEREKKGYNKIQ